jgi:cysteine desulfurase
MKPVYLDNSAATPIAPEVLRAMTDSVNFYGNPSSFNDSGREAKDQLQKFRRIIAGFLNANEREIIFTGSGSESNTLAIQGVLGHLKRGNIISTPVEHPSVIENLNSAEKNGFNVVYLSVNGEGRIDPGELRNKLNKNTILVSVMYANNEIGTIEPIKSVGKLIRNFRGRGNYPLFHIDACQAVEYCDMNVQNLGADLMTFNGSKIYGPRGIGVLFARRGVKLSPIIKGGGQESGFRAGTENLPAIVGLAKAVSLIKPGEGKRLYNLRDYFLSKIKSVLPEIRINSPADGSLPNNINISIPGLESEQLLLELDKYGIRAGSGSACTSRAVEPSHVLKAIGVRKPYLDGALRFSLGRQTNKKDLDYLLKTLPRVVSALNKRFRK